MNPRRIIRHVLVPHDFSELADVALGFALDLMQGPDARITLLHAYELIPYAFPEVPAFTLEMGHQIEVGARAALEGIAARVHRPDVAVGIALHRGTPWSEIVSAAKDLRVDLIAIGTHGRRGFSRVLLGSVTERVVRMAPCPVLTVHGAEAAK